MTNTTPTLRSSQSARAQTGPSCDACGGSRSNRISRTLQRDANQGGAFLQGVVDDE